MSVTVMNGNGELPSSKNKTPSSNGSGGSLLQGSRWFSSQQSTPSNKASEEEEERSALIRQMAQENGVKFGDEIRLFVKSNYLKYPKPAFLDPEHKGWTAEEKKGGYLGIYRKGEKARMLIPPIGNVADGTYTECHFRVEDIFSGPESYGHGVTYGDVVVLVDQDGMVWNNKNGGLWMDGYLTPRPRGTPGEVFVSFQKYKKKGEPVQYGDSGVFIDVEDSHRFREGFNNRLTNYKGTFSNVAGGYLNSDGSGEPLVFIVERYKGKVKERKGQVLDEIEDGSPPMLRRQLSSKQANLRRQASMTASLNMSSVSVSTSGVKSVMKISPAFDSPIILYDVYPESQIEIELQSHSTALIDGKDLLAKCVKPLIVKLSENQGQEIQLELSWTIETTSAKAASEKQEERVMKRNLMLAFVKLLLVYSLLFIILLEIWAFLNGPATVQEIPLTTATTTAITTTRRVSPYPRGFKRVRFFTFVVCWLFGLVTPPVFFRPKIVKKSSNPLITLTIGRTIIEKVQEPPESPVRVMQQQQEDTIKPMEEVDTEQPWIAAGKDPVTGNPLHFAWVRFLNGEHGHREVALNRWHITCDWRKESNIDGMLQRSHRLFFLIKAFYPHYFYGRSKYGHPIYIEQVGKVSTRGIRAQGGNLKDMLYHYVYTAEFLWSVLEPAEYGSSLTILDVNGVGVIDFVGEVREFVVKATQIVQEHYPERGFMVFIINAPWTFTTVWAIVSAGVSPATRQKVKILGRNYQDELFKVVDRASLPECYGGTNKRPLEDSDEEKMIRNIAARALLKNGDIAIGPNGESLTPEFLKSQIDPSVDHLMYKSLMQKVDVTGALLCDEKGRPLEKYPIT